MQCAKPLYLARSGSHPLLKLVVPPLPPSPHSQRPSPFSLLSFSLSFLFFLYFHFPSLFISLYFSFSLSLSLFSSLLLPLLLFIFFSTSLLLFLLFSDPFFHIYSNKNLFSLSLSLFSHLIFFSTLFSHLIGHFVPRCPRYYHSNSHMRCLTQWVQFSAPSSCLSTFRYILFWHSVSQCICTRANDKVFSSNITSLLLIFYSLKHRGPYG